MRHRTGVKLILRVKVILFERCIKKQLSDGHLSMYVFMYVCMPFYVVHCHNNLMKAHHYHKSHQISSASLEKMNIIILVFK